MELMLAGFDLNHFFDSLPKLLAELCAIYYAVRYGVKHGNGH